MRRLMDSPPRARTATERVASRAKRCYLVDGPLITLQLMPRPIPPLMARSATSSDYHNPAGPGVASREQSELQCTRYAEASRRSHTLILFPTSGNRWRGTTARNEAQVSPGSWVTSDPAELRRRNVPPTCARQGRGSHTPIGDCERTQTDRFQIIHSPPPPLRCN